MSFRPTLDLRGPQLGDCLDVMAALPDDSVCAVVTDPPYGVRKSGKAWDAAEIDAGTEAELERKERQRARGEIPMRLTGDLDRPGGRKLRPRSVSAFVNKAGEAGSYDFTEAGMDAFEDWCTAWAKEALRALKPGGHAVVLGGPRTFHRLQRALERAGYEPRDVLMWLFGQGFPKSRELDGGWGTALKPGYVPIALARKPFRSSVDKNRELHGTGGLNIDGCKVGDRYPANVLLDEDTAGELGAPARFFYSCKIRRGERHAGVDRHRFPDGNDHPTVAPIAVMRWLLRLVTPTGGLVLDPFLGSGTTACACALEGIEFIGSELEPHYLAIAEQRVAHWRAHAHDGQLELVA